ncbi:hypothetical protein FGO68_gene3889 [Halteria grandinella]|uniref:Uncharacterized protein n=1 Tax=Halteria grandinella TaxID=5974 RepID=A0A8J8SVI8_HALGN|nr:hypothetical protein FGO68_gene3889 [Halteria grandinella]
MLLLFAIFISLLMGQTQSISDNRDIPSCYRSFPKVVGSPFGNTFFYTMAYDSTLDQIAWGGSTTDRQLYGNSMSTTPYEDHLPVLGLTEAASLQSQKWSFAINKPLYSIRGISFSPSANYIAAYS